MFWDLTADQLEIIDKVQKYDDEFIDRLVVLILDLRLLKC